MKKKLFLIGTLVLLLLSFSILYWKKDSALRFKKKTSLSIADNGIYPQFCKSAVLNEKIFHTFKQNASYNLIHEYTTPEEGKIYLSLVQKQTPEWLTPEKVKKFQENDQLGTPKVFDFEAIGSFSPSTLRYLKVASDLKARFGDLNGLHIIEIGGGYGGQCKILADLFPFAKFTIIDFPESLELARKYLQQLHVDRVSFLTFDQLKSHYPCDLVISNYSFTELTARLQMLCIEKILQEARQGYVTCNFFPKHFRVRPLTKELLLRNLTHRKIPFQMIPEEPLTGKDNFILVWKQERKSKRMNLSQ